MFNHGSENQFFQLLPTKKSLRFCDDLNRFMHLNNWNPVRDVFQAVIEYLVVGTLLEEVHPQVSGLFGFTTLP